MGRSGARNSVIEPGKLKLKDSSRARESFVGVGIGTLARRAMRAGPRWLALAGCTD